MLNILQYMGCPHHIGPVPQTPKGVKIDGILIEKPWLLVLHGPLGVSPGIGFPSHLQCS